MWVDERQIPEELFLILGFPDLPIELKNDIQIACDEVNDMGAVSYPTKARIEHYINKHFDYLMKLVKDHEDSY